MILSVKIMVNPNDKCKYIHGDVWIGFDSSYEVIREKKLFIDPRMNDEELSIIMHSAKQYIRDRLSDFDFYTDDPAEEANMQKAIAGVLWKGVRVLTEQLPSPNGQLRSVVDLFRDESQAQWPKYEFKTNREDVDVCVEIAVIEDMSDVDFSDTDIVYNIKLLCEAVSDVERKRICTVQLISDILASHGHKCVNYAVWNMIEQCW